MIINLLTFRSNITGVSVQIQVMGMRKKTNES